MTVSTVLWQVKEEKIANPNSHFKNADGSSVKKQRNGTMTLLEHDMTGPCEGLIDTHIEQYSIHVQTKSLDCVEVHDADFNKISILQVDKIKASSDTLHTKPTMKLVYYMYSWQTHRNTHSTIAVDHFCC